MDLGSRVSDLRSSMVQRRVLLRLWFEDLPVGGLETKSRCLRFGRTLPIVSVVGMVVLLGITRFVAAALAHADNGGRRDRASIGALRIRIGLG